MRIKCRICGIEKEESNLQWRKKFDIYTCPDCIEKGIEIKNYIAEGGIFDLRSYYENDIICPYCGYEEPDSWEWDDNSTEYTCPHCARTSDLEVERVAKYTTERRTL